jgi:hypothetical protein
MARVFPIGGFKVLTFEWRRAFTRQRRCTLTKCGTRPSGLSAKFGGLGALQMLRTLRVKERSAARRYRGGMRRGVVAAVLLLAVACASAPAANVQIQTSPKAIVHTFGGGCLGTVLTDAEAPVWSQGGWSQAKGTSWPVPWALGTGGDAVAFLFTTRLVAGPSPRSDGSSNNKVGWVAKGAFNFIVQRWQPGQSQPVVEVPGAPSIVDVPTPGCWTFRLVWGPPAAGHTSIINLEALPAGSLP